jgi:hypothetical protein
MKTISNTGFFSDQVEIQPKTSTKHAFIATLLQGNSFMLKDYINELQAHLEAMKEVSSDDPEIKDVRVSWDTWTNSGTLVLKLVGTKPWSQDKIDAFENAAKEEKNEIDQMRLLIAKHPGKAAAALGYMLENQKATG